MDHICVIVPILSGKTEEARAFQRELSEQRMTEYDRSQGRIGITSEHWFIAAVPGGDQLVAYMDCANLGQSPSQFSQSRDDFDLWFKQRLAGVTGADLNNPPPDMQLPELVSSYTATR